MLIIRSLYPESDSIQSVARLMAEHHVGSIPVVSDAQGRRPVGMITDRDITCMVSATGKDPRTAKVSEVMSHNVVSCTAEDDIGGCAQAMQQNQIRRVPIVDAQGRCIGIVAMADLALKLSNPEPVRRTLAAIWQSSPHASVPRAA